MLNHQRGFTLLEWLISLSIGLFLLTFTSKLYISLYKVHTQLAGTFEIHENAKVAVSSLINDIRMSGFIGCVNLNEVATLESPYVFKYKLIGQTPGYHNTHLPLSIQQLPQVSDILCLQYADPHREKVLYAKDNTLEFTNQLYFNSQEVLLLSDCEHAEILQLKNIQIKHAYKEDAMISRFYRIVYYVGPTGRKNATGKPVYALYRKDLNNSKQPTELVENVEKLEIFYSIVNEKTDLQPVTAHNVKEWSEVGSVTLVLYLTSSYTPRDNTTFTFQKPRQTIQQTATIRSQ